MGSPAQCESIRTEQLRFDENGTIISGYLSIDGISYKLENLPYEFEMIPSGEHIRVKKWKLEGLRSKFLALTWKQLGSNMMVIDIVDFLVIRLISDPSGIIESSQSFDAWRLSISGTKSYLVEMNTPNRRKAFTEAWNIVAARTK